MKNNYWIKAIPAGPFGTNAYLFGQEDSSETVLIDTPPGSYNEIMTELSKRQRELTAVIITHPHFDHTLDAPIFSNAGITLYAHPEAISGIQKPETLGLIPEPEGGFPECGEIRSLKIDEIIQLAGMDLESLNVPGHSDGSVAISLSGHCFVGDVIFQGSVGRTDLPGGNFDVLEESIQTKIYTLPDDTMLYPGHGPVTSVGAEKRSNPFVRV